MDKKDVLAVCTPAQARLMLWLGDNPQATNAEIAQALGLSQGTVNRTLADIYDKLGLLNSREQLVCLLQQT